MSNTSANDIELFQQFCIRYANKRVREHFKDIENLPDDIPNPENMRQVGKLICLHKDKDPITLTIGRLLAFFLMFGDALDAEPFYGIPITTFHESNVFLPQVVLYFKEKTNEANTNNRNPIEAQVGFRITDENFTQSDVNSLALKIKQVFAVPRYTFKKGRTKFSYRDKTKGYELIITAFDETNARELIKAVLSLRNHTYDEELLTDSESKKNWNTQKNKTILGKQYKEPVRRPIGNVYFTHAELKIHGMNKDVVLVDTTGNKPRALQTTY